MKIYEYQAKDLFKKYAIPVPRGAVAKTVDEAEAAARSLGTIPLVLKAQIYAGGRGKAGGVQMIGDLAEIRSVASALLGRRLITVQTGSDGQPVNSLLLEEAVPVMNELYAGITIDRSARCPIVLASSEGGVEIEKLAMETPDKIVMERVDPAVGLRPFQASRLFFSLGLEPRLATRCASTVLNLYRLLIENECLNVEINPLVVTGDEELIALDGKVTIDDNALFRHPDLASLRDPGQENSLEVAASEFGLHYIKLKGNVGCMVNGAGLAMATMDLIKLAGAEPANFLDVGGGATSAMIREGLRILLFDGDVKILFINIFGGILRCDTLAAGVTDAARELEIRLPVVIRLEGTNKEAGEEVLASSGLDFIAVTGMGEAAEKIKELLKDKME